jgi:hypothetical protein
MAFLRLFVNVLTIAISFFWQFNVKTLVIINQPIKFVLVNQRGSFVGRSTRRGYLVLQERLSRPRTTHPGLSSRISLKFLIVICVFVHTC